MAIYEYLCPVCGTIEVFQKMSDQPLSEFPECAKAGKVSKVQRQISAPAFHLKGGGWYKTDYASSSGSSSNGHRHSHSSNGSSPDSSEKSEKKEESKEPKASSGAETKGPDTNAAE